MAIASLVLEYLKVLLSPQIVAGFVGLVFLYMFREDVKALFIRVAKIKFPGGAEVSTSQSERKIKEEGIEHESLPALELPPSLTPQQREVVESILKAERGTSYLWEYRYLNYFLVAET